MKRIVTALNALALVAMAAYVQGAGQPRPQSPCALTEATSPSVRGVRLGMSTDQLVALFPGSTRRREFREAVERVKASASGETAYLSFDHSDSSGDSLDGVGSVSVGLNKGRVMEFTFTYLGPTWRNVDEWVARLSESMKLPGARSWVVGPHETPNKVLSCNGIEIEAAIQGGGGSITIRNTEYVKGGEQVRNPTEEKKRREFKP